jgi:hypothetical protein
MFTLTSSGHSLLTSLRKNADEIFATMALLGEGSCPFFVKNNTGSSCHRPVASFLSLFLFVFYEVVSKTDER